MPIVPEPQATPARTRIDVNDEGDVEYWAHRFGVTRDEVAAAVLRVGDMVADVARHFGKPC